MHAKSHHYAIPAVAVTVALLGGIFTEFGMQWYTTDLMLPSYVPPDWVFPIVWTVLYIMIAGAAWIVWHEGPKKVLHLFATRESREEYKLLQWMFVVNALLNILWTLLFFVFQALALAAIEIVFLEISIIAMIVLSWKVSKTAAYLLMPYAVWVLFATYLTMRIAFLN